MSRFLLYVGRLIIILVGYLAGCIAASLFLTVLVLAGFGFDSAEMRFALAGTTLVTVPVIALFVAYYAFVPAMIGIFLAEFLDKRDWLFHAGAGAVTACIVIGLLSSRAEAAGDPALASARAILAIIASGIVGGIAYWAVSGRMAGSWRPASIAPER